MRIVTASTIPVITPVSTTSVYYCPLCTYNRKQPGKCPNCGANLVSTKKSADPDIVSNVHRREE